jgi:hypothetical protein
VKALIREDPELRRAKIDGPSLGRLLIFILLVAIGATIYFFIRRN